MKSEKLLIIGIPVVLLLLEILPYGVVLNFATPEGEPFRKTFSYFSMVPFGYAVFGPLITAILSCVLLLLCIAFCFKERKGILSAITVLSAIALVSAVSPIVYGFRYVTLYSIAIWVGLIALLSLSVLKQRKSA